MIFSVGLKRSFVLYGEFGPLELACLRALRALRYETNADLSGFLTCCCDLFFLFYSVVQCYDAFDPFELACLR